MRKLVPQETNYFAKSLVPRKDVVVSIVSKPSFPIGIQIMWKLMDHAYQSLIRQDKKKF